MSQMLLVRVFFLPCASYLPLHPITYCTVPLSYHHCHKPLVSYASLRFFFARLLQSLTYTSALFTLSLSQSHRSRYLMP
ncbi:uncharacterized protein BJ212DRAFT_556864 [Suillus subaureus]|uniref:Uncharacterized protein n=1 Tax=Suillus subaureus TaxID=48587 RepID=A0A9P7E4S9_9AGAM|nr:uncharacterized protein BJ212DRAFT_556864 [Suillus subaureus]KAG1811136.1 hypothetical protein BJ212DRAFT_556864 [Suillus subaureus]